jgi:hypothetical protein
LKLNFNSISEKYLSLVTITIVFNYIKIATIEMVPSMGRKMKGA